MGGKSREMSYGDLFSCQRIIPKATPTGKRNGKSDGRTPNAGCTIATTIARTKYENKKSVRRKTISSRLKGVCGSHKQSDG